MSIDQRSEVTSLDSTKQSRLVMIGWSGEAWQTQLATLPPHCCPLCLVARTYPLPSPHHQRISPYPFSKRLSTLHGPADADVESDRDLRDDSRSTNLNPSLDSPSAHSCALTQSSSRPFALPSRRAADLGAALERSDDLFSPLFDVRDTKISQDSIVPIFSTRDRAEKTTRIRRRHEASPFSRIYVSCYEELCLKLLSTEHGRYSVAFFSQVTSQFSILQ